VTRAVERLPGRFITLEGIEGVGKSTQVEFVVRFLREQGRDVVQTREPGGVPVAEQVRRILLDPGNAPLDPKAELLLMFAARAAHWSGLILPALRAGRWVVCDRFTDASYAYQGSGRALPRGFIDDLCGWVLAGGEPDLTLLLDAPWETVRERLAGRSADRFEQEDAAFFSRVREGYLGRAEAQPGRIRVIGAAAPAAEVQGAIASQLDEFVRKNA
jgi:dTMP kinase